MITSTKSLHRFSRTRALYSRNLPVKRGKTRGRTKEAMYYFERRPERMQVVER